MKKSDKYNNSGCLDMTAYLAIRNIENEYSRRTGIIKMNKKSKQGKNTVKGNPNERIKL